MVKYLSWKRPSRRGLLNCTDRCPGSPNLGNWNLGLSSRFPFNGLWSRKLWWAAFRRQRDVVLVCRSRWQTSFVKEDRTLQSYFRRWALDPASWPQCRVVSRPRFISLFVSLTGAGNDTAGAAYCWWCRFSYWHLSHDILYTVQEPVRLLWYTRANVFFH